MNVRRLAFLWLCACSVFVSRAHTLPISYLTIVPDAEYVHLELTFNPFELTFARELDRNHNGRIDAQEWQEQQTVVCQRMLDCLFLRVDGQRVLPSISGITPDLESHHATLRAHYPVDARNRALSIESRLSDITSVSHLTQVTFGEAEAPQRAQLDTQSRTATFLPNSSGEIAVTLPVQGGRWWMFVIGAAAVLAIATVVFVFGRSWRASGYFPVQPPSNNL